MADVFIYAMALGVKYNKTKELTKRVQNMPEGAFSERMRWLMRSVAILHTEDLEIFIDHKKIVKTIIVRSYQEINTAFQKKVIYSLTLRP